MICQKQKLHSNDKVKNIKKEKIIMIYFNKK